MLTCNAFSPTNDNIGLIWFKHILLSGFPSIWFNDSTYSSWHVTVIHDSSNSGGKSGPLGFLWSADPPPRWCKPEDEDMVYHICQGVVGSMQSPEKTPYTWISPPPFCCIVGLIQHVIFLFPVICIHTLSYAVTDTHLILGLISK